jgi:hypothetical protein
MSIRDSARARIRQLALGTAAAAVVITGAAVPAHAYTDELLGYWNDEPLLLFGKNSSSPLNSTLSAYVSVGGAAYRIVMRAGSGNGTTNACTSNAGWLPDGVYSNTDSDNDSHFTHYNKTWGNSVVRGWVWDLGDKACSSGKKRTELFIHSQGTSGWTNSNYGSAGCIKINQVDRSHLSSMYRSAYQSGNGELDVY